jgi:hypothetical protein
MILAGLLYAKRCIRLLNRDCSDAGSLRIKRGAVTSSVKDDGNTGPDPVALRIDARKCYAFDRPSQRLF